MRICCQDIEIAVARHFNPRLNLIVPNVSWGLPGLQYEADMVVLRPSGYAAEVEIKTSASDIKADLGKGHNHLCSLFSEIWFAVPEELADDPNIPDYAGILAVSRDPKKERLCVRVVRRGKRRSKRKFEDRHRLALLRLGCLRIWHLKEHIARLHKQEIFG